MQPTTDTILQSQKSSWNRFSTGWERWDDFTMRFLEPQGGAIADALGVKAGARVLDIATGTGDPGLRFAAGGAHVTALDVSEGMLRVAQNKADALGLDNFRTVTGDACALDFPDGSFDAISCRLGFMFFPDPQAAAREMARVLRPGGVIATTVWANASYNGWVTTIMGALAGHVTLPAPPPGSPGMFRCADPGAVPALFESAGLSVQQTSLLTGRMQCRTAQEYWQFMNAVVPPVVASLGDAEPALVAAVEADVLGALNGSVASSDKLSWGAHVVVARK